MFTGPLRVASPAKAEADRARVLSLVPFAKHLMGKLLQVHKHNDFRHLQKEMITPSGDIIRVTAIRPYIFNAFIVPFGMLVQEDPRIRRILGGFLLRPNEEEVAYRSPDLFFDPAPEEESLVNLVKVPQYHNNLTLGVVGEHYACGVNDPLGGGSFYNAAGSQFGKTAHVNDAVSAVEADTIGLWVTDIGDVVKVRRVSGELVLTFHFFDNPFTDPKQTLTIPESRTLTVNQWFVPSENGRVATAIWNVSEAPFGATRRLVTLEITHSDGEWSIIRYESPIAQEETPVLLYENSEDTFAMVVNTRPAPEGAYGPFMGHWDVRTELKQFVVSGGVHADYPYPNKWGSSPTAPAVNFHFIVPFGLPGASVSGPEWLDELETLEENDPGFIARCEDAKGRWNSTYSLPTIVCDGRTVITRDEWYEGTGIDGVWFVDYTHEDENGETLDFKRFLVVHYESGAHDVAHGILGGTEDGERVQDTVGTASGTTYRHSSTRLDLKYPIAPVFVGGQGFQGVSSSVSFSTQNFCGAENAPPHDTTPVPDTESVYDGDQLVCDIYDRDTRYREDEGFIEGVRKWDYASAVYPLHVNPSGLVRLSSAEMPYVFPETVRTVWVMAELYWMGEWTTLWEHEGTYERDFAVSVLEFADEPFPSVARNWDDRYLVVIRLPDPEATIAANEGKEWFDQEDWVWKEHFFIADGEGAILKTQESIIADVGSDEITPVRTLTGRIIE